MGGCIIKNKNRLNFKQIISIVASIIIILSSLLYSYITNNSKSPDSYTAVQGKINLEDWKQEKNIFLDGEWEFYPGVLIQPLENKDVFQENSQIKRYVSVPGSWESYLDNSGTTEGSGTYRLLILLPKDNNYGIKSRTIRLSNRIYLNGEEVSNAGNPSIKKDSFIPESKYRMGFSKSKNKELELIVHVSSYGYRSGGIIKAIEFGTLQSIIRGDQIERAIDGLIVSVCLILSFYFVFTYLQRRKELYLLYFSGTSLFMGLYLSTMNEQLLDLVINYNANGRIRIQIFAIIMVTICFLRFTYYFFREYINKKGMNFITGIMLVNLLFLFYSQQSTTLISLGLVQSFIVRGMLISYLYITYILLKAIYRRADSFGYILIIASSMISYWLVWSMKVYLEWDLAYLPVVLIFIMMMSIALLMSDKLQRDYQDVIMLSERLIAYDKLKDEFLVKASHELRTPLHVILNLTKSLIEGKKGTLNSRQQEDLFFVNREGKRLTRLVEDLLDAAEFEKGEAKIRLGSVDAYKIVEDILREMQFLITDNKDVALINQIPITFPKLKADPDKFIQIIYNLVNNAIKYTKSGEIIVTGSIFDGQALIEVIDTGIGLDAKDLLEIFDIFYQNKDIQDTDDGLGIGLPIVKHLVESQGGKIDVESSYGEGSKFKFILPLVNQMEEHINTIETTNRQTRKSYEAKINMEHHNGKDKYTVLIVDDETSNQKVMSDIIKDMGLNIIIASDGKEAIETIEKKKVDLVVLDFMLPDMSGDLVCRNIRKKYSMVELPILILTASGRIADLTSAFEYGANDFLKKPSEAEELKSRIQSLLLMKTSVEEGLNKEFQYFYSQISPHFLYNTLNTIIGLSYKEGEEARKALTNLSIYFRGKLDLHQGKSLIPLESELELVTAYLEIEKMRYGQRLDIQYDIEEDISAMIPPLTLQPLVENSITHGIAIRNSGGWIKISAKKHLNTVCITIEDNGPGMCIDKQQELLSGNSERVGFINVFEKMKRLKGAALELESKEGEGTKIKIIIPEVKYHESYFG